MQWFSSARQLTRINLQKLDKNEVAVSKLCCPSCWEFFDVLSEKHKLEGTKMYKIRGRHSTVYPQAVQLPSWTHPEVVQELIKWFDKHLHEQLVDMLTAHRRELDLRELWGLSSRSGHAHKPSLQSVMSAITTASCTSGDSNVNDSDGTQPSLGYLWQS